MFKSWQDIEQNFEVFLLMCGIMDDPSPAIDHMCEQFVTEINKDQLNFPDAEHLLKITKEIRSKEKFLDPFCNDHFYFVWQLPLKQQSRVYVFCENLDWLGIASNGSTTYLVHNMDAEISDCRVVISGTCLPPHDVLQAIGTLRQTISLLYITQPFILTDEACDNIPDHIFKIDSSATYIRIEKSLFYPKLLARIWVGSFQLATICQFCAFQTSLLLQRK